MSLPVLTSLRPVCVQELSGATPGFLKGVSKCRKSFNGSTTFTVLTCMFFSRNINFFSCYVSKKIPTTLRLQTLIPLDTNPGRQHLTRMKKISSGRSRTVVRFDILLTLRCTKLHSRHDKTLIMSRCCSCAQHAHISQLGQSVMLYIPEDTERVSEANIKY